MSCEIGGPSSPRDRGDYSDDESDSRPTRGPRRGTSQQEYIQKILLRVVIQGFRLVPVVSMHG